MRRRASSRFSVGTLLCAGSIALAWACSDDAPSKNEEHGDAQTSDATTDEEDANSKDDGGIVAPIEAGDALTETFDAGPLASAAQGSIVVDGVDDEAFWKSGQAATWNTSYAGTPTSASTTVRFVWSKAGLAMFATVEDTGLFTDTSKPTNVDRQNLYDEDCVELFFTPDPAFPNRYYEIELGPYGHFLDLAVDLDKNTYDTKWSSGLTLATKHDAAKRHSTAEALFTAKEIVNVLAGGKSFRIGLFRNEGRASDPGGRKFLAWSPPRTSAPKFHVPSAFGTLRLLP